MFLTPEPAPSAREGPARRLSASVLLALGLGGVALGLAHLEEALTIAGVLTLARVVRALAGRFPLAGIHPLTLDLGFVGGTGSPHEGGGEHHRGGGSQGNAGHLSSVHLSSLLELLRSDSEAPYAYPLSSAGALYAEPK